MTARARSRYSRSKLAMSAMRLSIDSTTSAPTRPSASPRMPAKIRICLRARPALAGGGLGGAGRAGGAPAGVAGAPRAQRGEPVQRVAQVGALLDRVRRQLVHLRLEVALGLIDALAVALRAEVDELLRERVRDRGGLVGIAVARGDLDDVRVRLGLDVDLVLEVADGARQAQVALDGARHRLGARQQHVRGGVALGVGRGA